MKFKSKIDKWVAGFTAGMVIINILLLIACIVKPKNDLTTITAVFTAINVAGVFPLLCTTQYTLSDDALSIRFSFLMNKKINYSDIISISTARCFVSSPALSEDRLCIRYRGKSAIETVYISPAKSKTFILQLCRLAHSTDSFAKNDAED